MKNIKTGEPDFSEPFAGEEPPFSNFEPNFENSEPDFEEPDFDEPSNSDNKNSEPDFEEPNFNEPTEPENLEGHSDSDNKNLHFEEPKISEPKNAEQPHKKIGLFFEFVNSSNTSNENDSIDKKEKDEFTTKNDNDIPKISKEKKKDSDDSKINCITAIFYLKFMYEILYQKCITMDEGVVGKILQECASAYDNALHAFFENNTSESDIYPEKYYTLQKFSEGFPNAQSVFTLQEIEDILRFLIDAEFYLNQTVYDSSDEKFMFCINITDNHIYVLTKLRNARERLEKSFLQTSWLCTNCHTSVTSTELPDICPHCKSKSKYFLPLDDYFPYYSII